MDNIISLIFRLLSFLVIIQVILTYFMSPYHPIRAFLDRIVEPMLNPIRKILPASLPLDFSPIILLVLFQLLEYLLVRIS